MNCRISQRLRDASRCKAMARLRDPELRQSTAPYGVVRAKYGGMKRRQCGSPHSKAGRKQGIDERGNVPKDSDGIEMHSNARPMKGTVLQGKGLALYGEASALTGFAM